MLPLEDKKLRYKTGGLHQFDAVVGNPPYGGTGIEFGEKLSGEITQLLESLAKYEIIASKLNQRNSEEDKQSLGLFDNIQLTIQNTAITDIKKVANTAKGMPIEILFVERFIQLAKSGGWIAVIIPDGILSNSNSHYVREFIAKKAKVEAIISLPRDAFKNVGTSAKTSILFLRKTKENENANQSYPVFMGSVRKISDDNFIKVKQMYVDFYNKGEKTMQKSKLVEITKDQDGNEAVMVRADKTLKEMTGEKPSNRWDVHYWEPKYDALDSTINNLKWNVEILGDNEKVDICTAFKGKQPKSSNKGDIYYVDSKNIAFTGINIVDNPSKIDMDSPANPERTRLKEKDILFVRSGEGSLGYVAINTDKSLKGNIRSEVYIIRTLKEKQLNPYYLTVYLKSPFFGQQQISRLENGVGTPNLNIDEITSIKIVIVGSIIQSHVESEYKKMSIFHTKAMKAKKDGNNQEYEKHLKISESMLTDLINKTEAVIRGKRDDVI